MEQANPGIKDMDYKKKWQIQEWSIMQHLDPNREHLNIVCFNCNIGFWFKDMEYQTS